MSQMLLPLSNLAVEIMTEWKGRIRAVAVANPPGHDEEENNDDDDSSDDDEILEPMRVLLGWQDVPYMRELLRVSPFFGVGSSLIVKELVFSISLCISIVFNFMHHCLYYIILAEAQVYPPS